VYKRQTYSHEENTHAHGFEDDVDDEDKQERADRVMELQQHISFELNQEKIGRTMEVVVDRKEGEFFVGRSEADSPEVDNEILISTQKKLKIGGFYDVEVYDAAEFDLFARPVGESKH
jgi:ribosomal protein S12 methylthiotransferase